MLCVGFLEEVIFRGLLFQAIAKDNIKSAVIISSVTFGIGHIINLFNGSGMDLVNNLCQIVFAFAIEQMVEQTDAATMHAEGNIRDKAKKAKMLPISVLFKARKLSMIISLVTFAFAGMFTPSHS